MPATSLLILIPTRNRADLARRAAESVLGTPGTVPVRVVISDNSTDPAASELLTRFVGTANDARLSYIKAAADLAMSPHWEWAIAQSVERYQPTHLMVLTDRMVLRAGALELIGKLLLRFPDAVVSFNIDRVNDLQRPVLLERRRWSGALCELACRSVQEIAAGGEFPDCIPRLLNCVAPVQALQGNLPAFGSMCTSNSPDYGFGFRFLALNRTYLYLDQSLLMQYAISRSNGISFTRGILSAEALDFRNRTGALQAFAGTPYPEFVTVNNGVLWEYCTTVEKLKLSDAPKVEKRPYLRMLWRDIESADDPAFSAHLLKMLAARGHRGAILVRAASRLFKTWAHPVELWARRWFRGPNYKPPHLAFASVDEALAYDREHPTPRQDSTAHLNRLSPTRFLSP